MEGPIKRKRYLRLRRWCDRYLVLKEGTSTLMYYHRKEDVEPRKRMELTGDCDVLGPNRSGHHWIFKLRFHKYDPTLDDEDDVSDEVPSSDMDRISGGGTSPQIQRRPLLRRLSGRALRKETAAEFEDPDSIEEEKLKARSTFTFAVSSFHDATQWKTALSKAVTRSIEEKRLSMSAQKRAEKADFGSVPDHLEAFLKEDPAAYSLNNHHLVVDRLSNGLTVYRELPDGDTHQLQLRNEKVVRMLRFPAGIGAIVAIFSYIMLHLSPSYCLLCFIALIVSLVLLMGHHSKTPPPQVLMAGKVVASDTEKVFDSIMNEDTHKMWNNSTFELRVLEQVDAHTDVLYLKLRPVSIFCGLYQLRTRDLVVRRYWCREEDGAYHIIYQSCSHPAAPKASSKVVRAHLPYFAYIISPARTPKLVSASQDSCYLLHVVRYDAKGLHRWIRLFGLPDFMFYAPLLNSIASLAHHIASMDYVESVFRGPQLERNDDHIHDSEVCTEGELNNTFNPSEANIHLENGLVVGIKRHPCSGDQTCLSEPHAPKFVVRGPNYLEDSRKIASEPAAFHMVGLDILTFEDGKARYGASASEGSLVQRFRSSHQNADDPSNFFFVVNIILPTKLNHCLLIYFQPSIADWQNRDTPFWKLFREFISQDTDDEFRNKRIKLIPDLVHAPFLLRNLLKTRPALIGTKKVDIKYYWGPNWFEQVIDVEADPHARFLTNMVLSGTKTLVVDLAFLIEGQSPDQLPERVIGCCRFTRCDLSKNKLVRKGGSLAPDS